MLKVVSLDVCGTLMDRTYLDFVWNEVVPALYAGKSGLELQDARSYVLKEYARIGPKDVRWYLPEFWFEYFNLGENPVGVFGSHTDKIRFYPEIPSVLDSLRRKYKLILASGIPLRYLEIIMQEFRHFFGSIFSCVTDLRETTKTTRFYKMICQTLKVEPSNMIHVGDGWYADFVTPRRIGIRSFFLDRTGEMRGRFVISDLRQLEDCLWHLS